MFFTHLNLYRCHDAEVISFEELADALAAFAYTPIKPRESRRTGWIPPAGRRSEMLVHEVQGHRLLTMQTVEKLMPASVINHLVQERVEDHEDRHGVPPSRRERTTIKEQVIDEMLPQAFVKPKSVELWWDTNRRIIGINAASRKQAEAVLDLLRQTLGSLKVTPLATKTPPSRAMTQWLSDIANRPSELLIGDQVELRAAEDDGVVRAREVDLDSEEMQSLLEGGRQACRLSLGSEGLLRAVLQDDLVLKTLRFDDAVLDEANQPADDDDTVLRLETDLALMAQTLSTFIGQLTEWLGGEAEPMAPAPTGDSNQEPHDDTNEPDKLLADATEFVIQEQRPSISAIQRRFKIGYNRAARLIEAMERLGTVSPKDTSGKRLVLTSDAVSELAS